MVSSVSGAFDDNKLGITMKCAAHSGPDGDSEQRVITTLLGKDAWSSARVRIRLHKCLENVFHAQAHRHVQKRGGMY